MVETKFHFENRLRDLGRKHKAMANGYTTRLRGDGLIVVKPKRKAIGFPFKSIAMLVVGFLLVKAFMLASIGPVTYNERVAKLQAGTVIEQSGAWVMRIDPVTVAIATFMDDMLL